MSTGISANALIVMIASVNSTPQVSSTPFPSAYEVKTKMPVFRLFLRGTLFAGLEQTFRSLVTNHCLRVDICNVNEGIPLMVDI